MQCTLYLSNYFGTKWIFWHLNCKSKCKFQIYRDSFTVSSTHSNTTLIKQKSCILNLSSELVRIQKHWKYLFHTANKFLSWILKHHLGPKCWVPSWNDDGRAIYKQITVLLFSPCLSNLRSNLVNYKNTYFAELTKCQNQV